MAQKNKVKELVGRGLNSYHTKALQQIHRIEKKNKEQNHKISILSNELDNDYLTKTEEGSVISLEHSKEGMVYLDELQGNTLVNYCTDGSKELTLNGDIDVEGTFVTTTEGVDNGLVDVYCEGNTLVNLSKAGKSLNIDNPNAKYFDYSPMLIKNKTYTLIYDITKVTNSSDNIIPNGVAMRIHYTDGTFVSIVDTNYKLGRVIKNFEIDSAKELSYFYMGWIRNYTDGMSVTMDNIMILEGDWSNKEIPPYFEEMKSVGQDDENGHKIEILSSNDVWHNKGFTRNCYIQGANGNIVMENNQPQNCVTDFIQVKPNTTYTRNGLNSVCYSHVFFDENKNRVDNINATDYSKPFTFTTPSNCKYLRFKFYLPTTGDVDTIYLIEGTGTEKKSNKKEILMNEPLRGLPNGIKDRFVKIGGKYFIERNTKKVIIDNNTPLQNSGLEGQETCKKFMVGLEVFSDRYVCNNFDSFVVCDTLPTLIQSERTKDVEFVSPDGWNINIFFSIKRSKLQGDTIADVKTYLQQNPIELIYRLATPIYEPLEIEPTLSCYTDVTHISNNSLIPCNMKIKNSGYNAIIKPSTQYTVALDTNKNGTIGMNLGGAKVTTTNNVATITTPATLTDDSLRLYGKGIKGSKVRLLEGDKTNWIPSHFEGMKSSFEDKAQSDGTYKMEILSEGKNKLNGYNFARSIFNSVKNSVLDTENKTIRYNASDIDNVILKSIKFKENTRYTIILKGFNSNEAIQSTNIKVIYTDGSSQPINNFIDGISVVVTFEGKTVSHLIGNWSTRTTTLYYDECGIFEGVNVPFEPYKYHNKIQFSSIEPLRAIGNYKDRLIFKDSKLMIERNTKEYTLKETSGWAYQDTQDYGGTLLFGTREITEVRPNMQLICNKFNSSNSNLMADNTYWRDIEGIGCWSARKNFNIRIKACRLSSPTLEGFKEWIGNNEIKVIYPISEPTYEEIPFELQKIILEGYESGTLFFDTNIPPTSTVTYAGETPIVKSVRLNKTEVLNNTNDINDNIIPYLMDMDYRVVCLQLQSEEFNDRVAMAKLFGGAYEMLQRDIQSKRYSVDEYRYRLDAYLSANKITEEEYNKLGDMLNE